MDSPWLAPSIFDAAVRDDLPPNVILIDGVAEDGRVVWSADGDTLVWAMTSRSWDALTSEQRAEFFT